MLLMNVLTLQYKKVSQSITIVVKDTLDGRTVDTIENLKISYFFNIGCGYDSYRNSPSTSAFSFHHYNSTRSQCQQLNTEDSLFVIK